MSLVSGLLGAVIGAWATARGVERQIQHQDAIAERILLRRALADLDGVLRSQFGHWTRPSEPDRHADGSYIPGPGYAPRIAFIRTTGVDLKPLPRSLLDRLFVLDQNLGGFMAGRMVATQDQWPRVITPELAADFAAGRRIRHETESLVAAITTYLGDPAPAKSG